MPDPAMKLVQTVSLYLSLPSFSQVRALHKMKQLEKYRFLKASTRTVGLIGKH